MKIIRTKTFSIKDRIKELKEGNKRYEDYDTRNRYLATDDEEVRKEWKKALNNDSKAIESQREKVKETNKRMRRILIPGSAAYAGIMAGVSGGNAKEVVGSTALGAAAGTAFSALGSHLNNRAQKKFEEKVEKAKKDPKSEEAKEVRRTLDNLEVADGKMSRKAFERKYYKKK